MLQVGQQWFLSLLLLLFCCGGNSLITALPTNDTASSAHCLWLVAKDAPSRDT